MQNHLLSIVGIPELGNRLKSPKRKLNKKNGITFSGNTSLLAVHCENVKSWFFADLFYNCCYNNRVVCVGTDLKDHPVIFLATS